MKSKKKYKQLEKDDPRYTITEIKTIIDKLREIDWATKPSRVIPSVIVMIAYNYLVYYLEDPKRIEEILNERSEH